MGSDLGQLRAGTGEDVSIHAPTWGATFVFNSLIADNCVSIHAPTWGATRRRAEERRREEVSIHAPTWGATCRRRRKRHTKSFNPRSHMGSDRRVPLLIVSSPSFNPRSHMGSDKIMSDKEKTMLVSIHAPTWGATNLTEMLSKDKWFQSTLPHGERLSTKT